MIKTLIFDWDGTIHDTKHLYGCSFRKVYQTLVDQGHVPEHYYSDEDLAGYLGMPGPVMWKAFMPELPEEIRNQASVQVGIEMSANIPTYSKLYPGALDALTELKRQGHRLVFLSNCRHIYMEAHRSHWKLDQWFDAFYCSEDYNFIPKEEIFPEIQKKFPGPYVVIGDRYTDLAIARVHKLPSIGCAYGFGTREELACAERIIENASELSSI